MRGFDSAIIALVAVMAIATGEATSLIAGGKPMAVETECPRIDPMDRTVHLKHEFVCSLFYKCLAGDGILQICPMEDKRTGDLLFFNPELQVCDWRRNVSCTNSKCNLNTDASGRPIKIPFDWKCRNYYDCVDNKLVIRQCPDNGEFDYEKKTCVPKGTAKCGPIANKCDTIYKELYEPNCGFYVTCYNGKKTVQPCPANTYFSRSRQNCVSRQDSDCDNKAPGGCTGNYKDSHPTDCSLYYKCENGVRVLYPCETGLHFNPFAQTCQDPSIAGCEKNPPTKPPPTTPPRTPCKGDGKVPVPGECTVYKQCVNGFVEVKSCGAGLHFNPFAHVCQTPDQAGCDRDPKPPARQCIGNGKAADHSDCNSYKECVNGVIVSKKCTPGLHFNPFAHICQSPKDAHCQPSVTPDPEPAECVGDAKVPIPEDCTSYKQCVNSKIVTKKCGLGLHFNPFAHLCQSPKDARCETTNPTSPPPVIGCNGTFKRPHNTDCKAYYKCVNHLEHLEFCAAGLHFNPYTQTCQKPKEARCEKPNCIKNGKIPHDFSCSHYYQCENGKGMVKACPTGQHFSPAALVCMKEADAGCDVNSPVTIPTSSPNLPVKCSPGVTTVLPHECQCDLFYSCENGIQVRQVCPDGQHFDHKTKTCGAANIVKCVRPIPGETPGTVTDPPAETPATPTRVPEVVCPNTPGVIKFPHETKCSLYWRCVSGKKSLSRCPKGLQYDIRDRLCNHAEKVGCVDKPDSSEGQSALAAFEQVISKAGSKRVAPADCPLDGSKDNHYFAHECFCNNYYTCQSGKFIIGSCPGNFHFDPEKESCELPHLSKCVDAIYSAKPTAALAAVTEDPATCIGTCPDEDDDMDFTVMLPNEDCSKFCMCSYGQATVRSCPPGLHFFPKTQTCTWPREAKCKPGRKPAVVENSIWAGIPFFGRYFL